MSFVIWLILASEYDGDEVQYNFNLPHQLALSEELDLLCVADRENWRALCYRLGASERSDAQLSELVYEFQGIPNDNGPVYGVAIAPKGWFNENTIKPFLSLSHRGSIFNLIYLIVSIPNHYWSTFVFKSRRNSLEMYGLASVEFYQYFSERLHNFLRFIWEQATSNCVLSNSSQATVDGLEIQQFIFSSRDFNRLTMPVLLPSNGW